MREVWSSRALDFPETWPCWSWGSTVHCERTRALLLVRFRRFWPGASSAMPLPQPPRSQRERRYAPFSASRAAAFLTGCAGAPRPLCRVIVRGKIKLYKVLLRSAPSRISPSPDNFPATTTLPLPHPNPRGGSVAPPPPPAHSTTPIPASRAARRRPRLLPRPFSSSRAGRSGCHQGSSYKNLAVLRTDYSGIGDFCVVLLAARPEG